MTFPSQQSQQERSGKASTLSFRVEPQTRQQLETIARKEGRSVGELLREAVAEWLNGRVAGVASGTDDSVRSLLVALRQAKEEGKSWAQISVEIEKEYGLRLSRNQMKALIEG